ncbi:hypothetical protein GE061_010285 [Apolygus lucorum]|uniref:G-protein coupled receptors family 2 profile 2 domain-containing protein n=1 Tax=Apolygus lucorum TaxID=248454 RepID=A0A8S9Y450_APOLU|nr:hypothetical protein GE061_010285 [Apolygus lucorum]
MRDDWLTETPLPLSSAPAPTLGGSAPTAPVNATLSPLGITNLTTPLTSTNFTRKNNKSTSAATTTEAEDYYNYDYPEPINSSGSLLRPETFEEEEVQLPSDSLADTDLHDHDRIDSIMYIYYGEGAAGRTGSLTVAQQAAQSPHNLQVVIVGAVVALVAQFLTLASALRRIREGDTPLTLLLNTELALTLSNLLFMLGVQATSERWMCETIAVTLHYAHLVATSWFFVNCFVSFRRVQLIFKPPLLLYAIAAWLLPAPLVYVCSLVNPGGYETRNYCWMSQNSLPTFMLPLSLFIASCVLVALGQKSPSKCAAETESDRKTLRLSAALLPMFSLVWLLSILALDNAESLVFPLLYVATNAFLNWFIFIWWLPGDERRSGIQRRASTPSRTAVPHQSSGDLRPTNGTDFDDFILSCYRTHLGAYNCGLKSPPSPDQTLCGLYI